MESKQLLGPCEWTKVAGSSRGELEGYGVFFGNVDEGDDVALPGSAKKTLADREQSGRPWPLIADHKLSTEGVVGSARHAREDQQGVRLRADFASTQKAQDLRTLVLEGHVDGLSITYQPVRHHFGQKSGRQVRFLDEIRIHEFTITPFPMNPQARIIAAKAAMSSASINDLPDSAFAYIEPGGKKDSEGKTTPRELRHFPVHDAAHVRDALARAPQSPFGDRAMAAIRAAAKRFGVQMSSSLDFEAFAESMRSALAIPAGFASKAAVDLLVASYHPDELPAAGPDDGQPTAGAAAATPEGADGTAETKDAAAYAASFLTPPGPPDGAPDGEPDALAYPQRLLESVKDTAAMDALEAQINTALGRAAT